MVRHRGGNTPCGAGRSCDRLGRRDFPGLTLGWGAPASAGTEPITAYDVRHIRSDAADRSDANWTVHLAAWRSGVLETR